MNKYIAPLCHHFEGCKLEAYLDGGGVATIGFGATYYQDGSKVRLGDTITQQDANILFDYHITEFTKGVLKIVEVPLTDYQEAALVSLAYNIGLTRFKDSTLLKELNRGDYEGAAQQFKMWRRDNGKIVSGLVRRRVSEERLFRGNTTDYIIPELPKNWMMYYYGE
jgi:lysozyme